MPHVVFFAFALARKLAPQIEAKPGAETAVDARIKRPAIIARVAAVVLTDTVHLYSIAPPS
jgi:hypothetical protein